MSLAARSRPPAARGHRGCHLEALPGIPRPKGPVAVSRSLIQFRQHRGQEPATLGEMTVSLPVAPQVTGHLRPRSYLPRLRQAELDRTAVLVVGIETVEPLRPAVPEGFLLRCQAWVPAPVPGAKLPFIALGTQLAEPELTDGVQQPVPGLTAPGTARQDRLRQQPVDQADAGSVLTPPAQTASAASRSRSPRTPTPGATCPARPPSAGRSSSPARPAKSDGAAGPLARLRIAAGTASRGATGSARATASASGPSQLDRQRNPSSRRHTPATGWLLPASSVNPGSTSAARSVNSRTASYRSRSAGTAG